LYLSKRSNGRYYIFYPQQNGKYTCISTGTRSKSEALKFLSNFENELKERLSKKVNPALLQFFTSEFLRYSESIHSWNHTLSLRTTLRQLYSSYGNISLVELTREKILLFVEKRLTTVSNYTVKRDIANMSSAFSYAISKKYLNENPCKGIKKPKIVERLPLFFSEAEFQILLRVIEDVDLRELITFAVHTGLRQSDLVNLEWHQISFQNQTLILDNRNSRTKSGKVHSIPLNIKALQILTDRQIKTIDSKRVFMYQSKPIKQIFISHKFKKFVKKAGLNPQLSFHCLRHSFASWLIQKGVPIFTVSKLLTHSDMRVTQIYSHLSEQNLLDAVNKLNN
jgi:integrase